MLTAALALAAYVGTTEYGGAYGQGSVFTAMHGARTTLYSFCPLGDGKCGDGANPVGNVVTLPDGSLVGTTSKGGRGAGTIFHILFTPNGPQLSVIWRVCWTFAVCDAYGTARGTLSWVGNDKFGNPIIKGVCEDEKGRGVLYRVTLTDSGDLIVPLDYWGKNSHMHAPVAVQ